ncbi:MAG: glycine cleavage system aminomethyltransferase GcvT [Kistimonas sp.]|nr:glycine cleavage system aminomethyltransferase GcvT [Kistimonas sp.]
MGQRSPLFAAHTQAGGRMIDFAGWDMPLHYGSQLEEHKTVREKAGLFDVSHMTAVDVQGEGSCAFLQKLLANDVGRLDEGRALYTAMLNDEGGVIDDLIAYRLSWGYRLVINCATREKDVRWMNLQATGHAVRLTERPELAMLAVQGPAARDLAASVATSRQAAMIQSLETFQAGEADGWLIARTGYTGEDGLEISLPAAEAEPFWSRLLQAGVSPCGLGCRDSLRLEAGLNLYGNEMDETITPFSANMGQTLAWEPADRDFIGRTALTAIQNKGGWDRLVGLIFEGRGVVRAGCPVMTEDAGTGTVTSGLFSPTLGHAIALARVPANTGKTARVLLRGREEEVRVTRPCFVRRGKKVPEQSS